jgi:ribosomal-protein-alanine N-acetyltransferase
MKRERKFPLITTARLRLRKPLRRDAQALLQITQDEVVMKYYGMSAFRDKTEALGEIAWFIKLFTHRNGIRWIITEQAKGQYIGDIGFHNYVSKHMRAEIGFKLSRAYWRQGIMTEVFAPVLAYGYLELGLNRIEAVVDPGNDACLGLLRKAGFREEGILREYEREDQGYVDLVMASLLRREYQRTIEK